MGAVEITFAIFVQKFQIIIIFWFDNYENCTIINCILLQGK